MSTFARVNKYHSGTSEQTKIMGTRVAYCVDMDKSVIIGNFEKRGWVAGWTIYLFLARRIQQQILKLQIQIFVNLFIISIN